MTDNENNNTASAASWSLIWLILSICIMANTTKEHAINCGIYYAWIFTKIDLILNAIVVGLFILTAGLSCFSVCSDIEFPYLLGTLSFSIILTFLCSIIIFLIYLGILIDDDPQKFSGYYEDSWTNWSADCNSTLVGNTTWYDIDVSMVKLKIIIFIMCLTCCGGISIIISCCGGCGSLCKNRDFSIV